MFSIRNYVKQPACNPSCLAPVGLALFPVCQLHLNFVHCPAGICPTPMKFFLMKILNKLADTDVLACGCNLLKDRRLWRFVLNPVPASSNEKIGELAR